MNLLVHCLLTLSSHLSCQGYWNRLGNSVLRGVSLISFTQVDAEDMALGLLLTRGKGVCSEEPGYVKSQAGFFLTNSPIQSSRVITERYVIFFLHDS